MVGYDEEEPDPHRDIEAYGACEAPDCIGRALGINAATRDLRLKDGDVTELFNLCELCANTIDEARCVYWLDERRARKV